ncbi:hypothetical protein Rhe02_57460 [Rhizocola hellebori]|uniref:Uncharacterized protein n=1 Tax=Rhizocola hellebori TaxID=1392758 RepID=A0A8J3QBF4_9ACTN|nr:hypothetical protein Rhe02_57460 [Rhizocola hellebori]
MAAATAVSTAAEQCGGALAFGDIAVCSSITGDREDNFTVTTTRANDLLYTMFKGGSGDYVSAQLKAPNGDPICYLFTSASTCQLAGAKTYTITVKLEWGEGTGDYSLSVQSMRTPSTCTTLPGTFFSFASTGIDGSLAAGSAGDCYRFNQPVGTVVHLWKTNGIGAGGADVQGMILDGQFQPVCQVRYANECTLTTAGPYHLNLSNYYGTAATYNFRIARISNAAGCAALKLTPFGDPGSNTGSGSLGGQESISCHKIRMPSAGTVGIRIYNGQSISWTAYDDAGLTVCYGYNLLSCNLPAAGDYTVILQNRDWNPVNYHIAAASLFRNGGCAINTGLSWALDAALVHQTSDVQTNCQLFHGNAGDRVVFYRAPIVYNTVVAWLVDSTGTSLCTEYSEQDGCVLPATGSYRIISYLNSWDSGTTDAMYKLQIRRLSQPAGCPVIRPGAYNAAPAGALGPIRCRILDIATPGRYIAKAFDAENNQTYAPVYDSTGTRICNDSSVCDIPAAGRYTMVLNGRAPGSVVDNDFSYYTTLLPYQPSGCTPVSDTGYAQAPHRGGFTTPGQYVCLQLPTPAGGRVVMLLPADATGAAYPNVYVLNSTGEYVCDSSWSLRQASCELTGTGPYTAVVTQRSGYVPSPFALSFARVDGPPACPVLPRDEAGATVSTNADSFATCFSIPADQHAARESFTWHRLTGTGEAAVSVYTADGLRYCYTFYGYADRTITCTLPEGPVTVVLEASGVEATYQVTHRDATTP